MTGSEPRCEGSRDIKVHDQVQWCPAWGQWLCATCRWHRNESELRNPAGAPGPAVTAEPLLIL